MLAALGGGASRYDEEGGEKEEAQRRATQEMAKAWKPRDPRLSGGCGRSCVVAADLPRSLESFLRQGREAEWSEGSLCVLEILRL